MQPRTLTLVLALFFLFGAARVKAGSDEAGKKNQRPAELLKPSKPDEAVGQLLKALELNPKDEAAQLNLAYACARLGRIDEAISRYQKVIELSPKNTLAHNNVGVLYDKKGRHEAAIREFETVLDIDPKDVKGSENLATAKKNQAIVEERDRQLAEALSGAKAHPTSPIHAYKVARFHAFYGNRDQAIEWLDKSLALGFNDFGYVKIDTALESLRDDPDYRWLVRGH